MAPGAKKNKFGAPWSNLSSFESKFTVLKKVIATLLGLFGGSRSNSAPPQWFSVPIVKWRPGNCATLAPVVTPLTASKKYNFTVLHIQQSTPLPTLGFFIGIAWRQNQHILFVWFNTSQRLLVLNEAILSNK